MRPLPCARTFRPRSASCLLALGLLTTLGLSTLGLALEVTLPELGSLDGTTAFSAWTNRTIFQYQGIPYVEPSLGHLRFRPPEPYRRQWLQTFNATAFGPVCPQHKGLKVVNATISEDCLYINVYTPKTEGGGVGRGLPVVVFIHGGTFMMGSGRNLLPHNLLERDIVLVVPQYRLGTFGFLSLKTDDIPGNQGMLDIILALEWVNKNIQYFGGDPSQVTLAGHSAGAGAVTVMMLSPLVRDDLFHRVAILSGSIFGNWGTDPEPIKHARMIASFLNCPQRNMDLLATCLKLKTTDDLVNAHDFYGSLGISIGHQVVWNEANNRSLFKEAPNILLKQKKIKILPMLASVTKHDGSFVVAALHDIAKSQRLGLSSNALTLDNLHLILEHIGIEDPTGLLTNLLAERYFKEADFKDFQKMVPGLIDIAGVSIIKATVLALVRMMSHTTESYLYSFNYLGNYSCHGYFSTSGISQPRIWNYPFPSGISHGDEMLYLFPQRYAPLKGEDKIMAKKMVQIFGNFIEHGKPMADGFPEWPKFSGDRGPYLRIEKSPTIRHNFVDEFFVALDESRTSNNALCLEDKK